jgi:transposase
VSVLDGWLGITLFKRYGVGARSSAFYVVAGQESLDSLGREELIRIILEQQKLIEQLRAEIEQLKRRGSAAPFSKGPSKANPKVPGRKPGQGPFLRRDAPTVAPDQFVIPVAVSARCCPDCGGQLGEEQPELVSVTDIPVQPKPEVRLYAVGVRRCRRCGRSVRGRHPEVAADQQGATAHRLGQRVKALGHVLHYQHGVPVRKVPAVIEEMTGLRLTQSALTQDALKQNDGPLGSAYRRLRETIGRADVAHTDDTGWRIGGRTAFLMVFATRTETVYQIRERHRNQEVREVISSQFAGVMVCDRGRSYDAEALVAVAQQKCLAHLIRNAGEIADSKKGRAKEFGQNLKQLLKRALGLAAERATLPAADYQQRVGELNGQLTDHLRNRIFRDDDNQRLLNGVGTQQDRGNLLRFLNDPRIEPTNNRAERALRPAVIARKVSHCSKNERGARAFEAFVSVLQTARNTCTTRITDTLSCLLDGTQAAPT